MKRTVLRIALGLPGIVLLPAVALGQYTTQRLELEPGWNAVYLEIDPTPSSTADLVERSQGAIESIWHYDNRYAGERAFEPHEFAEDIEIPPVRVKNRWYVYHARYPEVSKLFAIHGSRAYMILVDENRESFTLELTGRATPVDPSWVTDDFSLKGFPIDPSVEPASRPTFASWFAGSAVHLAEGSEIYATSPDGQMLGPLDKASTRIEPARAYWIYTDGASRYGGPIEVGGVGKEGLDFGKALVEARLDLRNTTAVAREGTLRLRRTLAEVPDDAPGYAGDVRLQFLKVEGDSSRWVDIDEEGERIVLPPESTRTIRIQTRRKGLPIAFVDYSGGVPSGSSFQGEVQFTQDDGATLRIVANVEVTNPTGLWTGTARLRFVRKLQRPPPQLGLPGAFDPEADVPTSFPDTLDGKDDAPELEIPLILHIGKPDPQGDHELTLLRQVALMWKEGDKLIPGRYVLLTRKGLAAGLIESLGLVGGALQDGRRFSRLKTAPDFHKDFVLEGPPGDFQGSGKWTTSIVIPRNDPLNPFIHRYHPDHGHPKVIRNTGGVPARGGMPVERYLTMDFSPTDPVAGTFEIGGETVTVEPRPQYGDTIIGGTYREVILAPIYDPVVVQGSFELRKAIGGIDRLDDGQTLP